MKENKKKEDRMMKYRVLLIVVTLISLFCVTCVAETSGVCGDNLTWVLDDEGVLTISGTGDMSDYYLDYAPRAPWYDSRNAVKSVVIEEGATSIGNHAFTGCYYLTSVVIPEGITSIGREAFKQCNSLTSITIPDSVNAIDTDVFKSITAVIYAHREANSAKALSRGMRN